MAMNIIEIMHRWPDQGTALAHLERVRWGGIPSCPYCGSRKSCVHASKDKKSPRWQCQDCRRAFSVTVGTVFHHTHLPLQTWFLALAIMLNSRRHVSNAQLSRYLGLPYKTAWSLAFRIRKAMLNDPSQAHLFADIVKAEKRFVVGEPRSRGAGKIGAATAAPRRNKVGSASGEIGKQGQGLPGLKGDSTALTM